MTRKCSPAECRKKGYDPKTMNSAQLTKEQLKELMKCSKGFPKAVPVSEENRMRADPRVDFAGLLKYNPCRDDGYVNNYNPLFLFLWGANLDMQVLHKSGMLYRTPSVMTNRYTCCVGIYKWLH